jgi:hypothetical protein
VKGAKEAGRSRERMDHARMYSRRGTWRMADQPKPTLPTSTPGTHTTASHPQRYRHLVAQAQLKADVAVAQARVDDATKLEDLGRRTRRRWLWRGRA